MSELSDMTARHAYIVPRLKSAVDALNRIALGTGTITDLAEVALAVNEGRTRWGGPVISREVLNAINSLGTGAELAREAGRDLECEQLSERRDALRKRWEAVEAYQC